MNERVVLPDSSHNPLVLGIPGFTYADLYQPSRLAALLEVFDADFAASDADAFARFAAYRRSQGDGMTPEAISEVLVEAAGHVGRFLSRLFGVDDARKAQQTRVQTEFDTIFKLKHDLLEGLTKRFKGQDPASWDRAVIAQQMQYLREIARSANDPYGDSEFLTAKTGTGLLDLASRLAASETAAEGDTAALRETIKSRAAQAFGEILAQQDPQAFVAGLVDSVARWCHLCALDPEFAPETAEWALFRHPEKTDWNALVEFVKDERGEYHALMGPASHRRRRVGFSLTDPRFEARRVHHEIDHCIYCHDRDADSCSKGMRQKKEGGFKTNALGVTATGCPLGEKISEMHLVRRNGDSLGALALVIIDNPMCPGTGHRICNDCMKGCIYQKTEPVNIPQIETHVLTDVLFMPWGFEIYSFLTRWNPLNIKRPHALPYNGKNVLVVGLGPAGYTLSHYLLNEGFGVAGIDALKIEPLPEALVGAPGNLPSPIRDFRVMYDDLDTRTNLGFGGVAEYGITVRWDKNFLKVIYLTLLRRESFRVYGGVRFGGTLSIDDAWAFGFDHIALATGAGQPTVIGLKNNLIRGIRKASDFLMGLQLTGAAKDAALANLQVRLPAGVVGGGLTAIDTATEVLAYYPKQVTKILERYEALCASTGEDALRARFDREELGILDEFLGHGRAIRAERERAAAAGEAPDFATLCRRWGGVTLFYRKDISDSPAYRQNHEEIKEALAESIALAPGMNPQEALADEFGALRAVRFESTQGGGKTDIEVPLRALFVAAGTSPNVIYEQENPGTFALAGKFFQDFELAGRAMTPGPGAGTLKLTAVAPFTSYAGQGRRISFYGDNHPLYAGNVVKAMASAKDGYPHVVALFAEELAKLDPAAQTARDAALAALFRRMDETLLATIVRVERLTPTIIEVVMKAPYAARGFEPGQFYRVQNFEADAEAVRGTTLSAEGLALTGAWVDKEAGIVSTIALEMGTSSRLCATWKPGQRVVVMGVTGAPTHIPRDQTVIMAGGGLGNAVLFSIGKALRNAGNRVVYFAGYKKAQDVFKLDDIEAAADVVIWSVDRTPDAVAPTPRRPGDRAFVGNIVEAMVAYASGDLGAVEIRLEDADEFIVIGSDLMMAAVKAARFGVLAPFLKAGHRAIGSINSPMQCMMKGICAQCMCRHVDPVTGKESFVYSCYNQDQPLDLVDFPHLRGRLRQNSVQEKLGNLWLHQIVPGLGA
jgi:NADPH-dependent glutamate synthase beta subunit-like oxidoreductase/NAD(P)H-flavin reductase